MFAIVSLAKTSHLVKLTVNVGGSYYTKGMETERGIITAIFVKDLPHCPYFTEL